MMANNKTKLLKMNLFLIVSWKQSLEGDQIR